MDLNTIKSVLPYIELCITTLANPVLLLAVLAFHPLVAPIGLTLTAAKSYNSLQVLGLPYLLTCLGVGALGQILSYYVLTLGQPIGFMDFVLSQRITALGWVVYLITLCCTYLFTRSEGIEGNVIGFIFFPVLLVCAAYQTIHHFIWVYQCFLDIPYAQH